MQCVCILYLFIALPPTSTSRVVGDVRHCGLIRIIMYIPQTTREHTRTHTLGRLVEWVLWNARNSHVIHSLSLLKSILCLYFLSSSFSKLNWFRQANRKKMWKFSFLVMATLLYGALCKFFLHFVLVPLMYCMFCNSTGQVNPGGNGNGVTVVDVSASVMHFNALLLLNIFIFLAVWPTGILRTRHGWKSSTQRRKFIAKSWWSMSEI